MVVVDPGVDHRDVDAATGVAEPALRDVGAGHRDRERELGLERARRLVERGRLHRVDGRDAVEVADLRDRLVARRDRDAVEERAVGEALPVGDARVLGLGLEAAALGGQRRPARAVRGRRALQLDEPLRRVRRRRRSPQPRPRSRRRARRTAQPPQRRPGAAVTSPSPSPSSVRAVISRRTSTLKKEDRIIGERFAVDVELGEHLVQVVLDGPRADEQPGADLRVREPVAGEPGDLASCAVSSPRSRRCACGPSRRWPAARARRASANASMPAVRQQLVGGAQLLARVEPAPLRGAAIRRRAGARGRARRARGCARAARSPRGSSAPPPRRRRAARACAPRAPAPSRCR